MADPEDKIDYTLHAIERCELDVLDRIAKQLYTEDRLNGDQMRNMAQRIDYIVRRALEVKVPTCK
jgi:hypothetical protein